MIEIAESSLEFDRSTKGSLYARAGIPDYWIVNLLDEVLEVYRDPTADVSTALGWRYRSIVRMQRGDSIVPLALTEISIPVGHLLR